MRLLIDENVPNSVAEFFSSRGHEVLFVREVLLPGTPDAVIAAVADEMAAIIVTWNYRDFDRLVSRFPEGSRRTFRRLGRISFKCNETRGRKRLEELIDLIEFEYSQSLSRRDKRLIVEIGETFFRTVR